jgi:hypothetical protein
MMQCMIRLQRTLFTGQKFKFGARGRADGCGPHEPATSLIPEADMLTAAVLEAFLKIDVKTVGRHA